MFLQGPCRCFERPLTSPIWCVRERRVIDQVSITLLRDLVNNFFCFIPLSLEAMLEFNSIENNFVFLVLGKFKYSIMPLNSNIHYLILAYILIFKTAFSIILELNKKFPAI